MSFRKSKLILLIGLLTFGLAACGEKGDNPGKLNQEIAEASSNVDKGNTENTDLVSNDNKNEDIKDKNTEKESNDKGQEKHKNSKVQAIYDALDKNEYEEALVLIKATEDSLETREKERLLGISYIGVLDNKKAIEHLVNCLSNSNGYIGELDYDTNYYLALAYSREGHYEKALDIYKAIINIKEDETRAHYFSGVTLLNMGRKTDAILAFDKAMELSVNGNKSDFEQIIEIYLVLDQYGYTEQGREYIQTVLKNNTIKDDLNKGKMYFYINEYQSAIDIIEPLLEVESPKKESELSMFLGLSYEALGDKNYAVKVYENSLKKKEDAALYNQLGVCQLERKSYDSALEAFKQGLELEDPIYTKYLRFNEIVALEYLGEFEKVKGLLVEYLKSYPNDEAAIREQKFLKTR